MAILILALLAAVASFSVMGGRDGLRARRLGRIAQDYAIRYSRDDPYQCPQLYEAFLLMRSAHSARACHVLHGQVGSTPVRLFEHRCEAGHGTHRQTRAYRVLVLEHPQPLEAALLWNAQDASASPLETRHDSYPLSAWKARGPGEIAESLAREIEDALGSDFSLETRGQLAMLFVPMEAMPLRDCGQWLEQIPRLDKALQIAARPSQALSPCNV